jgi:natural product precursor
MNESKKLALSKETLRCLDDQELTDVVGGDGRHDGGGGNQQSVALACISDAVNSCVCIQSVICGIFL